MGGGGAAEILSNYGEGHPGFPKLISSEVKASKTIGTINPTKPSVQMANKGQSSFVINAILYNCRAYPIYSFGKPGGQA